MIQEPKCFTRRCRWFLGVYGRTEAEQVLVCGAFPKHIPFDIAYGDNNHLEPIPGDHGIQYEKAEPGV